MGAFANRFADWMPFEISVEPWDTTFTADGTPNYAAPILLKCQIEEKVRMVRDALGAERVSNTKVIALGGPLDSHDRVTMPGSFKGPSQPPILAVSNVNDIDGFSHVEIYL